MRPVTFNPGRPLFQSQPKAHRDFIAAIARIQAEMGLGHVRFAAVLGVSDSLWRHTRDGRKRLGIKLLAAGAKLVDHRTFTAAQDSILTRDGPAPREDAA